MLARAVLAAVVAVIPFAPSGYAAEKGVRVRANSYDPRAVQVQAGDTVVWTWDASQHTVTAVDGSFDSDRNCSAPSCRAAGRKFSHTFRKPGIYAYRCKVLPAMVGHVEVVAAKAPPPSSGPAPAPPPQGGGQRQPGSTTGPAPPPPQAPPAQAAPPARPRMAAVPGLSYANAPPAPEPAPQPIPPAVAPRRDPLSILPEGGPPPIMAEEPEEPPAQLALEVPARPQAPSTGLVVGIAIATLLVTAGAFGKFVLFRPPWS
ncbi:MAG: plastocyanin/azurin family copper-binding protein [Nitriliruptorales bacterium]